MPVVDLSMVGLEGQQAYATRLQTLAQGKQMEAAAKEQELANQETEKMEALNQEGSKRIRDAMMGNKPQGSPFSSAEEESLSSIADPVEILAKVYSEGGAPGKGAELLQHASTMRKQEADIESGRITDETHRLDNIIKVADLTSRYLGVAKNQSEYEYGLNRIEEQGIVDPALIAQLRATPWNEDVTAFLNEQAISAKDRATLDLNIQTQESLELARVRSANNADRRTAIAAAAQASAESYRKAQVKAAGAKAGPSNSANAQERAMATNAVSVALFGGKKDKTANLAFMGDEIAGRAKAKILTNPALTFNQAIQQSITEAKMDGTFTEVSVEEGGGWFGIGSTTVKKPKYNPGRTKETAVPVPAQPSPKNMSKGTYYVTPYGIMQWDGKDFVD